MKFIRMEQVANVSEWTKSYKYSIIFPKCIMANAIYFYLLWWNWNFWSGWKISDNLVYDPRDFTHIKKVKCKVSMMIGIAGHYPDDIHRYTNDSSCTVFLNFAIQFYPNRMIGQSSYIRLRLRHKYTLHISYYLPPYTRWACEHSF